MPAEFDHQALLDLWFADCREHPERIAARNAYWFGSDENRDRQLSAHYLDACEAAHQGLLASYENEPQQRLALILLLDQLPRNLFRGTARAFESDAAALRLCLDGNETGIDRALNPIERVFFWMPLQHAEDLGLQNLGVELFSSLAAEDPTRADTWNGFASFARLHRDIVARFGRFPHRNRVLGREATPEETEYLESGAESFGQ